MEVTIHYHRLSERGLTLYVEDLVEDSPTRMITYKTLPDEIRQSLSETFWREAMMAPPRQVGFVRKYYFYNEPFTILEFIDTDEQLIAYYSDIATPLERRDDEWHITDLFLDWWIEPHHGAVRELDWHEFEEARQRGWLTPAQADYAQAAMDRVRAEIQAGVFPFSYI